MLAEQVPNAGQIRVGFGGPESQLGIFAVLEQLFIKLGGVAGERLRMGQIAAIVSVVSNAGQQTVDRTGSDAKVVHRRNSMLSFRPVRPQCQECRGQASQRDNGHRRGGDGDKGDVAAGPFAGALHKGGPAGADGLALQEPVQVVRQVLRGGVASGGFFRHCLEDDRFQIGGDREVDSPGCGWFLFVDLPQECRPVGGVERRPQREQLVERCAERIDIGAMVEHHARALRLFRAHVTERAQQVAGHREVGVALDTCQAEVGEPQAAAGVDQEVRGLDIAVDDAAGVGMLQRLGRLDGELSDRAEETGAVRGAEGGEGGDGNGVLFVGPASRAGHSRVVAIVGKCRSARGTYLLDHLRQALAFDELHRVEVDAAIGTDGVDRHDVGVVQLAGRAGFVAEACQAALIEHRREGQHLQGHAAAERDLLGFVDDAHAAAADLADDAEVAQRAGCWMLDVGCRRKRLAVASWMCGVGRPAHRQSQETRAQQSQETRAQRWSWRSRTGNIRTPSALAWRAATAVIDRRILDARRPKHPGRPARPLGCDR